MDDNDAEYEDMPPATAEDDDTPDQALMGDADDAIDPAEQLRDLVVYLASNLTDQPDDVEVTAERRGQAIHLSLRVPEDELGKVIGRQGRIARAMRTALMVAGSRHRVRATLDIEG